jgi:hypothetical protein
MRKASRPVRISGLNDSYEKRRFDNSINLIHAGRAAKQFSSLAQLLCIRTLFCIPAGHFKHPKLAIIEIDAA